MFITSVFLCHMAFTLPMGQGIASIASKASKSLFPKLSEALIAQLNQEAKGKTIFAFGGKRATENLLPKIIDRAKRGFDPSHEDLSLLDSYSAMNNHGILNFADDNGHTLLYYVLHNNSSLSGYKGILKQLYARGAQLSIRDQFVMGPEAELKAALHLPINAPAGTTLKIAHTFFTKNTPEKIKQRFYEFGVLKPEGEARTKKAEYIEKLYQRVKSNLFEQKQKEAQAKKDGYFNFDELI